MQVKVYTIGPLNTNCYVVVDGDEAVIIDPGGDPQEVISSIQGKKVKAIVATHGHFDHVLGVNEIKKRVSAPFLLNGRDLDLLKASSKMAETFGIKIEKIIEPDLFISEGDTIVIGRRELRVIETPGHTMGSCCLLGKEEIFTGDTLFANTIGRTDLGGSKEAMFRSLERIKALDDNLVVYPGHGNSTILGYEKETNPFLNGEITQDDI
ncbi:MULTISPECIES: MBL fold metallo-hydrolase [Acidianus]|uniref:Beta-lactamase n=1 Tax=Candidatus Acidianus copahuensis TaxID=1160895 RepID=A0A031LSB3_9CREN|nr:MULTISPECIES: MBL fold metallo-hydrolase [Acidianus]EZQ10706.1 beta-lactamase [Candidatus Acidianus copahuensis]NON63290.1 MBL fold metallo-hydrolase [Acidianus sp. RZ1]